MGNQNARDANQSEMWKCTSSNTFTNNDCSGTPATFATSGCSDLQIDKETTWSLKVPTACTGNTYCGTFASIADLTNMGSEDGSTHKRAISEEDKPNAAASVAASSQTVLLLPVPAVALVFN